MFQRLFLWVQRLFNKKPNTITEKEASEAAERSRRFENTDVINFDSIFAEYLAKKATSDSDIEITDSNDGESKRSAFIADAIATVWDKIKPITSQALGKGGKLLVPYVVGDNVFVTAIDQGRCTMFAMDGNDNITSVTLIADTRAVGTRIYHRMVDYTLENTTATVSTKAISVDSGNEVPLETIPEWAGITPEITFSNVDRLPIAFLKCPKDSREEGGFYGVQITYGSEDIIRQLYDCLKDVEIEYKRKKVFVGADEFLFGKDGQLPDGIFKKLQIGGALKENGHAFWEVFDPAIRDSSYYNRWMQLCYLLEKSVGTSKGVLTEPTTTTATATEIKYANYDTFCMVSDIRKNIEKCINDLAYAIDLFAERFGLTPAGARGDYQITFNWDMSLLESSTETFNQFAELYSHSLLSGARWAAWATGDTLEEAQAEIDAIRDAAPTVDETAGE